MNTPNPLVPQGSLPQGAPRKLNIRLIVFGIVAVHAVFFGGLLIQGCKPKEDTTTKPQETVTLPTLPTPAPEPTPTNVLPPVPDPSTLGPAPTGTAGTLPPPVAAPATPILSPSVPATPVLPPVVSTPTVPPVVDTAPAPSGSTTEHVIKKGDSFSVIAKKYKVSVAAISKANPGVDSSKLKLGQKIQVPAPALTAVSSGTGSSTTAVSEGSATYVVKAGDTLSRIAAKNKTTTKTIRALNNLRSDRINVGQKLKLPAKAGSAPALVPPPAAPPETAPFIPAPTAPVVPATVPAPTSNP